MTKTNRFRHHALAAAAFVALPALAGSAAAADPAKADDKQRAVIEQVVRDLLKREPELVMKALQEIDERQNKAEAEARDKEIATVVKEVRGAEHLLRAGKKDAPIAFVEFLDYNCGYCKAMHPRMEAVLKEQADVGVVYVQFPILAETSAYAARAVIALSRLDAAKGLALHEALLLTRGGLSAEQILDLARKAGADAAKLEAAMGEPATEKALRESQDWAERLQVRGTPAFIVGRQFVGGAVATETLKTMIEEARVSARAGRG